MLTLSWHARIPTHLMFTIKISMMTSSLMQSLLIACSPYPGINAHLMVVFTVGILMDANEPGLHLHLMLKMTIGKMAC